MLHVPIQTTLTRVENVLPSSTPITIEIDSASESFEIFDHNQTMRLIEQHLSNGEENPVYHVDGEDVIPLVASTSTFQSLAGHTITPNLRFLHFHMDDPNSSEASNFIQARLVVSSPGHMPGLGIYQFRAKEVIEFSKRFVFIDGVRYYSIVIDGTGMREGKQKKQLIFPLAQI